MDKPFLGRGWKFPIQVDSTTGRIRMSEGEEDIKEAIKIILRTTKGERVMRANFGCSLDRFVFDSTDPTTLRQLEYTIEEAIRNWEPRVEDTEIHAVPDSKDSAKLLLNIAYKVRATNNLFNLVFPFYLEEGVK
ncbi:MAG: GPW/gp25 family protein [Paenibacillaceae bacterium]